MSNKISKTLDLTLIKGVDYEIVLELLDDEDELFPLSNSNSVKMLVKYGSPAGTVLEWTESAGYFTKLTPLSNAQVKFKLTKAQIEALAFKTANLFLFIEPSGGEAIVEGTIIVK